MKTQQAPTLCWFSSQDSLEKLLEKSQITSKPDKTRDFPYGDSQPGTDDDQRNCVLSSVNLPCPSVTEATSVPEFNTVDFYGRTRASLQYSSGADTSSQSETSESQKTLNTISDTSNVPSNSEASSSTFTRDLLSNLIDRDNSTVSDIESTLSEYTNHRESPVVNTENHKAQESGRPDGIVSEPKLIHCSETLIKTTDKEDTDKQETVTVRSAPILPSERTLFRTDDNIVLVVEDRKILVSKTLLSLHSEFFKAMFATDMKESQQSEIGKYHRLIGAAVQ